MKRFGLILLVLLCCLHVVHAQTTEGTEFWVTFMNNYNTPAGDSQVTLKLIASSREDASLTVENPQTGYTQTFAVQADHVAEFTVPHEQGYTFNAGSVEKRGLCVTSTAPISLYASNFEEHTYDASIVLPVTALGVDYAVQVYESLGMAKEMAVVATQDNTILTITPHARTSNGKVKNVPFSVNLNAGETYMLMSYDAGNDFSGTRVLANYPVAVFAGHQCIYVPSDNRACDHIVEQQMPVQMWGKQFVLTKTKGQYGDLVLVTARDANTEVKVNGLKVTTLQAWESYEFRLADNSAFVETSRPAACYLYLEGAERNDFIGDPSSVHISPVEQRVKELTFATFQTSISRTHYVNIVTTIAGAQSMMLDGKSISSEFAEVQGNSKMRFAQVRIPHGTHTLKTGIDGFTGHVYGLGDCESYAYTFGSAARLLDGQILVDGVPRSNMVYDETRCYKMPITFSPHTNVEFNTIEWDFGDGQKSTQKTNIHTYASAGTYHVEMRIANEDGKDTARTTLTLVETLRDTIYATICNGEKFTLAGETFTTAGKHEVVLSSAGGCDSIVTLCLTVGETYETNETATFRKGSSYRWHNRWYREDGEYRDTLPTVYGCDSIFILTLASIEASVEMTDTICWQPTYHFRGYDYVLPPVDNYKDQEYINYTLEYFDKEECEHYRMDLAIVPMENGSYELYEDIQDGDTYDFFGDKISVEGDYTKTIGSACNCVQEYTLHLRVHSYPINKVKTSLCKNGSYTYRGKQYTAPGVYRDTIFSPAGIEEVYELALSDNRSFTEISISNVPSYVFNGKMLTKSGTYRDTLTNAAGCDSIITLYLGINAKCSITEEINQSLCEGETLLWNEQTCIPGNTYTVSLTSAGGCDSIVTLHLKKLEKKHENVSVEICEGDFYRVGETKYTDPGEYIIPLSTTDGCDSVVTLQLALKKNWTDTTHVTINIGETYSWQNRVYNEEGIYSKGYIAQNGCDSIVVLDLKVDKTCQATRDTTAVICFGLSQEWYGTTYDESGDYQHLLHFEDKCDTMLTLHLTVLPEAVSHENKFIYTGEQYNWNGRHYNESGTYEWHTTNNHGCDSTAWLHLTVSDKPIYDSTETVVKCSGETFIWQGEERTPSATQNTFTARLFGLDTDTLIVLTVIVNPVYTSVEETQYICNGDYIDWNGIVCDEEKDYVASLHTKAGCDSIVTLHLKHYSRYADVVDPQQICEGDSYTWEGDVYTESGDYIKTLKTIHNCDSVVTLRLTVHPKCTTTDEEAMVCYGESYAWNSETYTESGIYTQHLLSTHGCDSTVTRRITVLPEAVSHENKFIYTGEQYNWNGRHYNESGTYEWHTTNNHGCDSTAWLHLTVSDKPIYDSTEFVTQCAGEKYAWHGQTLIPDMGKTIFTHLLPGQDADTLITLTFYLWPRYENIVQTEYICDGEVYIWEGAEYKNEGDYTRDLKTIHNCDSIVTFRLRLYPRYDNVVDKRTAFIGESYTWQGETYTEDVSVTRTLSTIHGCDSIVTLDLTFVEKPSLTREEYANICAGESYSFYDESFYEDIEYSVVRYGIEADTLVTLHLSVWPTYDHMEQTEWICPGQPYKWNGKEYLEEGDYTQTLSSVHECDSIVTLHLHHYTQYIQNLYDTILPGQSYDFIDHTYTQSGSYTHTLHTIHGCDSSLILNLVVNEVVMGAIQGNELCADESVVEILLTYTGTVDQVQLLFDEKAHMAGWRDTLLMMPDDRVITIPIHGRAGVYTCHISLLFHGQVATTTASTISMLYPSSVLEQAWNDVIAVLTHDYNGGYNFTNFQWYENGQIIVGETRSYLYRPLIMGGEYSALLTEQDGTQLMTCPLVVSPQSDVTLYPTIVSPLQKVNCRVSEDVDVILYDAVGNIILNTTMVRGEDYIEAPATAGIYIVNIISRVSHKSKTYKLVVR